MFPFTTDKLRLLGTLVLGLLGIGWLVATVLDENAKLLNYFEPLIALGPAFAVAVDWRELRQQEAEKRQERERPTPLTLAEARRDLLANQQNAHIDGVLAKRLFEQVRIRLQLDDLPQLLQPTMQRRLGTERQLIPLGTPLVELYRGSAGRKLLLLGQPGAGKTTLLLELLRDLLHEAQRNDQSHIPVYLNLSNWAASEPGMVEWVGERLLAEYTIARKVSQEWLAEDRLALLLDGLDEVARERRGNCVDAINRLVAKHPMPLVICSRTTDYELLEKRLNLTQAVEIAPLAPPQIQAYLTDPRLQLGSVYALLQQDEALAALAQTPLMLSFMALAFRGQTEASLWQLLQSTNDRQQSLLNAFLVARLRDEERTSLIDAKYDILTRLRWLRFLAQQLERHNLQQYFIDEMQPDWLEESSLTTYLLIDKLAGGVLGGLIYGLGFWLLIRSFLGLFIGLLGALITASDSHFIKRVEILKWRQPTMSTIIRLLILSGLQGGALAIGGSLVQTQGSAWGGIGTFFCILVIWLANGWFFNELINGLTMGLAVGGVSWLLVSKTDFGLANGLTFALSSVLWHTLSEVMRTTSSLSRTSPNQSIQQAKRLAIRMGLVFGLASGLLSGSLFGLTYGPVFGFIIGLSLGLFIYGGEEYLQHYLLRWMLARQGAFPPLRQLIPFLDAMARRVLLVHAGAHYRFVHRTLQEHVAALSNADLMRLVAQIEA